MARSNPRQGGEHNHYRDVGFRRGYISPAQGVKKIRELGEHVLAAAKAALKESVDEVVKDAKSLCPVRTGRLRDSIKAVSNKDGSVYVISADASVESKKAESGRFYYGPVVEFSPKINKPFMYPALEENRKKIRENIDRAIEKAVRSV